MDKHHSARFCGPQTSVTKRLGKHLGFCKAIQQSRRLQRTSSKCKCRWVLTCALPHIVCYCDYSQYCVFVCVPDVQLDNIALDPREQTSFLVFLYVYDPILWICSMLAGWDDVKSPSDDWVGGLCIRVFEIELSGFLYKYTFHAVRFSFTGPSVICV